MSSITSSPPEQGQLVSVHSRQWIVNDVRPRTLPASTLKPPFHGPQHLITLSSLDTVRLEEAFAPIAIRESDQRIDLVQRPDQPDSRKVQETEMRYRADITAGALKLPESRLIADLLLREVDAEGWKDAIVKKNVLQARSPATASRLTKLIRGRLEMMGPDLWKLVRDGKGTVATHAVFAAAVKHSPLLGDFLEIVVGEQYRLFSTALSNKLFADYLEGCRERDPNMPQWNDSTRMRLRSSVFQMLAQAGYIENTRSLKLQTVHIAEQVLRYLKANHEDYVLRCIQVAP